MSATASPVSATRPLTDIDFGTATLDDVIERNRGFVITVARQYRRLGVPMDDLLSAGHLGLIEAARRYDPSRGARFVTYAVWWIRKGILEAIARQSGIVAVPAYQRRLARRLQDDAEAAARIRRQPVTTIHEVRIDDRFGSTEAPRRELQAPQSFDPERTAIREEEIDTIRLAVSALPEREREVIRHRFGLDDAPVLSLHEIGARLGLSRERVRQIETGALAMLRARAKRNSVAARLAR
jgi:RNA polymerase primary sigma factor